MYDRSLRIYTLFLAFTLFFPVLNVWAQPISRRPNFAQISQDEIIVIFRKGVHDARKDWFHFTAGARLKKSFAALPDIDVVKLPAKLSVKNAIELYKGNPDVLHVEPNYLTTAVVLPNDPQFSTQWNLNNTGQAGGAVDADIDGAEAWNITTGSSNVVVGVVDTGIDYNHQDLAANMFRNTADCNNNGIDDDGNGFIDDCFGINATNDNSDPMDTDNHGTHVAGIIGAIGNNGTGVAGINWNARLLACKSINGPLSDVIDCLDYIAMMKDRGINIIATNNSWTIGSSFSQALQDAINAHRQRGILFIVAAGNDAHDNDANPTYPCSYYLANLICVASTTRTDAVSSFSNIGRRTVHLGAPGSEILSTTRGNTYSVFSGTSMAAPHVTGVAAALKAQDPTRDWRAIKNLILAGGDIKSSLTNTITQRRLNANGALTCSNTAVRTRVLPVGDNLLGSIGTPVNLAFLNINCASPDGVVNVTINPGGQVLTLLDDGNGADQNAGDGIYSGQWTPTAGGSFVVSFPDGDVTVQVVPNYAYTPTTFNYRGISGTNLNLTDDSSVTINLPFPVQFGGSAFSTLFVNSNGYVSFASPITFPVNSAIPVAQASNLVAPFWDDLFPTAASGQNVFWDVTGAAPNRELVVEWRDLRHYSCNTDSSATVKFQAVFFEANSNILFNYADTMFGGACASADGGASATVGIQSTSTSGTQFSFNTASLSSNSSLLWTIIPAISVNPNSQDFGNVNVGSSTDRSFTVKNTGGGTLSGAASTSAPYSIFSGGSYNLGAGQSQTVTVRFNPTAPGAFLGTVSFTGGGGTTTNVSGVGVAPISITVNPLTAAAGATVMITWAGVVSPSTTDWVALSTPSAPNNQYIDWFYTSSCTKAAISPARASGSCSFTLPAALGQGSYEIRLLSNNQYVILTTTPLSIASPPVVTVTASSPNVSEAAGTATFTLSRTGPTTQALTVNYTMAGTATLGQDYSGPSSPGSVVIQAGQTSALVTMTAIEDSLSEGDETVTMALTANAAYTVGSPASATITITDNDGPAVGVNPTSAAPGAAVTINWAGVFSPSTTDWVALSTPSAPNNQYIDWFYTSSCTKAAVSPARASGSCSFTLPASLGQGSYEVRLLSNNQYVIVARTPLTVGTGNLPLVTVLANSATIAEAGGTSSFTVSRSGSTAAPLTVNFTVGGTASLGQDYLGLSSPGSVVIQTGQSSAILTITALDDVLSEGDESVTVTLSSNAAYAIGSPASATVTIVDDEPTIGLPLTVNPSIVPPGGTVTATWSGLPSPSATDWIGLYAPTAANTSYLEWMYVSCSKSPGTARATGSCNFPMPAGLTNGTYQLRLLSNNGFSVIMTSNAFVVGGPPLPVVTITTAANAAEPATNGQFTVSRSDTVGDLTVFYAVSGSSTATSGADYQTLTGSVTIVSGQLSGAIAVSIIDDSVYEGSESLVLTLSNNSSYTVGSPGTATMIIGDDDPPPPGPTLSVTPTTTSRGGNVTAPWSGIVTPSARDWIGLYAVGAPDSPFWAWEYVSCSSAATVARATGSCGFAIPFTPPPGTYELRLFSNDSYNRLAISNPFALQ